MPGGAGFEYHQSSTSLPPNTPISPGHNSPTSLGGSLRGPNPFGPSLGYDPARPQGIVKEKVIVNTRIELPASAYALEGPAFDLPTGHYPERPCLNTEGKSVIVRVNQFKVLEWPSDDIWQYDLSFGQGTEKRGRIMAVWKSPQMQRALDSHIRGRGPFVWDGNKIGWCKLQLPAFHITVDLELDKTKPRRTPREDKCIVQVRPSKVIRMAVLSGYLSRQTPFDNGVLEAINFLDHIMRQLPSENYTMIKRSFFSRGNMSQQLDDCITALKGCYASMRLCSRTASIGGDNIPPSTGLAINVDVANGTFWTAQDVHQCARNYLKHRNSGKDFDKFIKLLFPVVDVKHNGITMSDDFKNLRKLTKLRFTVKHRGKGDDHKTYSIKKFSFGTDGKYHKEGMNAKTTIFRWKNPKNNFIEEDISIYNYFKLVYNIQLQYWQLPLVCTDKGGMFPMECCTLVPHQRYMYKLSPDQTANMIKFAVTRPKDRIKSIEHGIQMLNWSQDKYLNYFGVKVERNMTQTRARLLPPPEIQFGAGGKIAPGTAGRWDLRGKKFYMPNPAPLTSWGFVVLRGCVEDSVLTNFINVFITTYTGHGGRVTNKNPSHYYQKPGESYADTLQAARYHAGQSGKIVPQILFVVLPDRDSDAYATLKKNMDCRWAMVSQFLNVAHVKKAQPQYCSNVAMKVNAKLGGITSKVIEPPGKSFFTGPTMIIGADVSHATPGSPQGSMAAITVSMDVNACRYAAAVETNGSRVEMITKSNIASMLGPLFRVWCNNYKKIPEHIYYFRDGVSEGQFAHVINQEVADMKEVLLTIFPGKETTVSAIKWTVTICTKRHHIRIFPKENDSSAGDRNNNPLPGILIENDVTHPFEYDFYLNSHAAIQGTSRPVHYQVILDEARVHPNRFMSMVYNMSYQYIRSTTPVSLFPAVYYAHLASNRARSHEATPSSQGPRGGQKFEEMQQDQAIDAANARMAGGGQRHTIQNTSHSGTAQPPIDIAPLIPMGCPESQDQIISMRTGMWYV